MLFAMSMSLVLVLITIWIHFEVFRLTSRVLPRYAQNGHSCVLIVVFGTFVAHIIEVVPYAGAFYVLEYGLTVGSLTFGPDATVMDYIYYSIDMYTSLGLGDVAPDRHLRIISGIEALNGLVLIGWSASFTFLAMRHYWPLGSSDDAP